MNPKHTDCSTERAPIMTTTAKGYLVTSIKTYAYDKAGKPIETTIATEDIPSIMEHFNTTPVTSVILEDFKAEDLFEVDLCSMVTLEDGSKKEQAYSYTIDGVTHYVSLTIYLEAGDGARMRNLMESNTWKLPAKFNPNAEHVLFF